MTRLPLSEGLRLFTWPDSLPGEAPLLRDLLEIHGFVLHLRKPRLPRPAIRALLEGLPEAALARIMLHDQPGLAEALPVRGVVWNARHPLPENAEEARREMRGTAAQPARFGLSAHSLDRLEHPPAGVDEIFFAPVYDSHSKPGHSPVETIESIRSALERGTPRPTLALGGIEEFRFLEILGAGFDGAAVLGSLWLPWQEELTRTPDIKAVLTRAERLAELWAQAVRGGV